MVLAALGFWLGAASLAQAQQWPTLPPNTVMGRLNIGPGPAQAVPISALTGTILSSMSGDCTMTISGVITCLDTNGTPFGTFATQNYATPPAIGGTTPNTAKFSSVTDTGVTGSTQCVQANSAGTLSGFGSGCGVSSAGLGSVVLYYSPSASAWQYQEPNGTIVTPSTTTCGLQEAFTYAFDNSYSLIAYGQGAAFPCDINDTQIDVPPAYGVSAKLINWQFNFTSMGSKVGFHIDTQRYGFFDCSSCNTYYSGTGGPWSVQPTEGPGAISCTSNSTACWALDEKYDFGVSFIQSGATANACVYVDPSQGNGSSALLSSAVVDDVFSFFCEGQQNVDYGFQVASPSNVYQDGGEQLVFVNYLEGTNIAAIKIGNTSSNDPNLGTDLIYGTPTITGTNTSNAAIADDAQQDRYILTSLNCNQNVASQINVVWGSNATLNVIETPQALECGGGYVTDNSSAKTNRIFLAGAQVPLPVTIANLPTCNSTTNLWLMEVSNGVSSPTYNAAVSTTGSTLDLTYCNGSGWTYH